MFYVIFYLNIFRIITETEKVMCKDKYITMRYNDRTDGVELCRKHCIQTLTSFKNFDTKK